VAILVGEDQAIGMFDRELPDVLGQRRDDDVRQGNRPVRGAGLWRRQERVLVGEKDELLIDSYCPSQKVDAIEAKSEALALSHAGSGR
jgi:hypothetical protein